MPNLNLKNDLSFTSLLKYIWPIEKNELPKFLAMSVLLFCILFTHYILSALKDSIIVTQTAVEAIPFLRILGGMPTSLLVAIIYVSMLKRMDGERIFYIILSSFLIFFTFFTFVVVPNEAIFHLSDVQTTNLIEGMPHLKWFIILMSKWTFSLFFIIAELWPGTVFFLLFWQFINSVISVGESSRFYLLFGLIPIIGMYFAGCLLDNLINFSNYTINLFALNASTSVIYNQLALSIVIFLIIAAMYLFKFLNHNILHTNRLKSQVQKERLSIIESFKFALGSRSIRLIALVLICYGMSIGLVEGPWKVTVRKLYVYSEDYSAFMGRCLINTTIPTVIFIIIGSNIMRKFGWFATAMITPVMLIVTGALFFSIVIFNIDLTFMMETADPLMLAAIIGAGYKLLSKSTYTVFNATKEMSYVPLSYELKTYGKVVEGFIGVQLGRSLIGLTQSLLLIFTQATYESITPLLIMIFIVISVIWLWAVKELNVEYNKLIKNNEI